ncbi:MAG: hypothetical protein NTU53_17715, partial [Planctomycetota bacterium]|nr:hypothetical protein [Planctomycetota bacterium]
MQILPLTALLLVSVSNLLAADTPATGDDLSAGEFAIWREGDNIALGDWTVTLHFAPGPVFSFNLRNPAVPYDVVLRSSPVSEDGMGRAYWNAGTNWSGSGQWGTGGVINTYKYFDSVKSKWLTFTYDWNGFVDLLMSSGPSNGTFTVPLPSGFSIGPFTVIGCQLNLTTAYDAYINDNTVVLLNQNATLTSLTVGGPEFPLTGLDFDGARTLVVQNTLHNRGIVDLFSQGVVKTGAIANFGTLRNFRGTVDGDFINHGQVDLATSLTTNGLFVTTGLLSVNGVLTVAGNQPATFGGQVVLHDAVLQTLTGSRISASSPLILGTGTLSITLSDGTVNIGGAGMPTALTLSGSVGQSGSYVISHGAQCLLNRSNLSNDGQIEVVGVGSVLRTTDNDFGGNNDWEASAGLLGKGRVLVKEGGLLELAANITDAHPSPVGWAQEHVHGRVENSVEIDAASKLVSRGSGHWNEIVGAVVNYGTIDVQQRLDLLGPVSSSGRVSIGNCLNIAGGQTAVLGGEVTLAGGSLQTSNGSGITATSPMVTGTGTVDATIQGGMMNVGGSGTSLVLKGKVEAGAGYRIVDGAQCLLNRSNLSNDGQIEVVGVGSVLRTTDNDFGGNNDW